jgi:ATP-dependent HslUV protease subunit HslV
MRHSAAFHGTTILAVRHEGRVAMAGDGQVTQGQTVVKQRAKKIQRLYEGRVLAGFAGSTADAFALIHRFEARLEEFRGNLQRAAVELAKEWRTDRALRRLEAFLLVADREATFLLSGAGDVISPDDGIVAVGSGGPLATAAARALARHAAALDAATIAREALRIAAEICIYTNDQIEVETLEG